LPAIPSPPHHRLLACPHKFSFSCLPSIHDEHKTRQRQAHLHRCRRIDLGVIQFEPCCCEIETLELSLPLRGCSLPGPAAATSLGAWPGAGTASGCH
jgi:hypothetical protein